MQEADIKDEYKNGTNIIISKKILEELGLQIETINNKEIERDFFLNMQKYDSMKKYIIDLKKEYSSSSLTSLQENATTKQKFPLLNLVRQILSVYGYKMVPIRKCDGYTNDKRKKFKRFFLIVKDNINLEK